MNNKNILTFWYFTLILFTASAQRQIRDLPDIPGYKTLTADLHVHTLFSDGRVWPTIRIDEAVEEGIDIIALTDHIEVRLWTEYLTASHNASYEVAKKYADERNVILIQGAEITREMLTGHYNVLFINDADKLTDEDFMTVMEEAYRQGAFIFWNHPGWKKQQPDGVPKFHAPQLALLEKGWLHGVEFYNTNCAYKFVLDWCSERDLTVLSNSDVHVIASDFFNYPEGGHRPLTLIFAEERSEESVKEALFDGRTLSLYSGDSLAGDEQWARSFFESSITVHEPHFEDNENVYFEITNHSSVPYFLQNTSKTDELKRLNLKPKTSTMVEVPESGKKSYTFEVKNILIRSTEHLKVELDLLE